ncbi:MAG: hypothetical protein F9K23_02260 [Bacteroidetes bacterium]|nr:MAG: hypothetical protein F9K23_02260 [Bacteroidota bacterium]
MRSVDDLCLLCLINPATKKNSHILPKFMTKSILGTSNQKAGYILQSLKPFDKSKVQDSPKEDFILCESCERYFEILETYVSQRLHNRLWDIRKNSEFEDHINNDGIRWRSSKQININVFKLFLFSILWRSSVSSHPLFNLYKISEEEKDVFRTELIRFRVNQQKELLEKVDNDSTINIFYIILTCQSFGDETKNVIFPYSNSGNPHSFYLNRYLIFFSFTNFSLNQFDFLVNSQNKNLNLGFLSPEFWQVFLDYLVAFYSKIAVENINPPSI